MKAKTKTRTDTAGRLAALKTARDAYYRAVRAVLELRPIGGEDGCDDPACPGWFVESDSLDVARCDACATAGGYSTTLSDHDVAALPEAHEKRAEVGDAMVTW